MIRIEFDPARIAGSLLLNLYDLNDPAGLAVKLRDSADPLSQHLLGAFTPATQQALQQFTGGGPLPESLRDTLIDELNHLVKSSDLYEKRRFRGAAWERDTLMKELIKQELRADDLACRNRLLLEEAYPDELKKSPKAEWDGWNILARAATLKVIAEWEEWKRKRVEWKQNRVGPAPVFNPKWQDDVWKGFRDWLREYVFRDKCAYCETPIMGFHGDAEHFRPKGQVRAILDDESSEIVKIVDEDNEKIPHPGYFWLAYHWQNILPSCEVCNRFGGKKDLFPVGRSHVAVKRLTVQEVDNLLYKLTKSPSADDIYYLEPGDLDAIEDRLLLHPYYDKPEEHIYFQQDGKAAAWEGSGRGKVSIKVYDLNERTKIKARANAQFAGFKNYNSKLAAARAGVDRVSEWKRLAQELKDEYYNGSQPFAVAVFDYIHGVLEGTLLDPDVLLGDRRDKSQN